MRVDLSETEEARKVIKLSTQGTQMRYHTSMRAPNNSAFFRVCPHCGTEFYLNTAAREDADGRNYMSIKFMGTCMVCGGQQPPEHSTDEQIFFTEGSKWDKPDDVFKKIRRKWKESYRLAAEDRLQRTLDNLSLVKQPEIQSKQSTLIRGNRKLLCDYIEHILNVESAIYATEKRLQELYFMDTAASIDSLAQNGEILFKAKQELAKAMSTYSALQKEDVSSLVKRDEINIGPKPVEPSKPASFSMREPQEPLYDAPGFLNKKKVLAKNEALRLAYQEELRAYEVAKTTHAEKMQEYKQQYAKYQENYSEYVTRQTEEQARVEEEYRASLSKEKELHTQKVEEASLIVKEKQHKFDELKSTPPQTAAMTIIREEITTAEKTLGELMQCREQLYAQNVVYPKYRNIVAIASFNDYFMSGRCDALEGANGAYDKYEVECRADLIISKLTDVLSSIEQIKDNQCMLYHQISEVNTGLSKLNSSTEKAVAVLTKISVDTSAVKGSVSKISDHTKKIAENSNVIAYNTAATAFYAKKNAELTNALGFLIALK